MTLYDQMAALMPGLRWTRRKPGMSSGWSAGRRVVFVARCVRSHRLSVNMMGLWYGHCQSPTHAADTIRRKLREFIEIFGQALEETT